MTTPKRARLLEAAEELFQRQGFHATGIDRICAAAGVVRMTLYNHFPSKEALVLAVLRARHERFLEALDQAMAASPPGGTLTALVDAHGEWLRQHGGHGCIMVRALGEHAEQGPAIHALALAAKADMRARLAAALDRDGLNPGDDLVLRIFLLLEGCGAAVPVAGADAALDATHQAVEDLLDGAAGASP